MKVRNYEKKTLIYILLIFLILLEIIIVILFYKNKINIYVNIQGVVVKDNLVVLIVIDKSNASF